MERFLKTALMFGLLCTAVKRAHAQQAPGDEWYVISNDDSLQVALNTRRIRRDGAGVLEGWVQYVYKAERASPEGLTGNFRRLVSNRMFDCSMMRTQDLQRAYYDGANHYIGMLDVPKKSREWRSVVPQTLGEYELTELCRLAKRR